MAAAAARFVLRNARKYRVVTCAREFACSFADREVKTLRDIRARINSRAPPPPALHVSLPPYLSRVLFVIALLPLFHEPEQSGQN